MPSEHDDMLFLSFVPFELAADMSFATTPRSVTVMIVPAASAVNPHVTDDNSIKTVKTSDNAFFICISSLQRIYKFFDIKSYNLILFYRIK